jgi:hypothetical protein
MLGWIFCDGARGEDAVAIGADEMAENIRLEAGSRQTVILKA